MNEGIGVTTKETYRMACTSCRFTRPTDDIAEIHGIVPVFCQCGEIMVSEIVGVRRTNVQGQPTQNEKVAK